MFWFGFVFGNIVISFVCFNILVLARAKIALVNMMNEYIANKINIIELNKIYIYGLGYVNNNTNYNMYTIQKNNEERVMILKESMVSFNFKVGDRFIIPEINNLEINITEELKDTVQFYSFDGNNVTHLTQYLPNSLSLRFIVFEKRISQQLTNYVKSKKSQ